MHGLRTQLRSWVMDNRRRSVWKDTDPDKMKLTYPAMPQIPQHLEVLTVRMYERRSQYNSATEDEFDLWDGDMQTDVAE